MSVANVFGYYTWPNSCPFYAVTLGLFHDPYFIPFFELLMNMASLRTEVTNPCRFYTCNTFFCVLLSRTNFFYCCPADVYSDTLANIPTCILYF